MVKVKKKKLDFMVDSDLEIIEILNDMDKREEKGELEFVSFDEAYKKGLEKLDFLKT